MSTVMISDESGLAWSLGIREYLSVVKSIYSFVHGITPKHSMTRLYLQATIIDYITGDFFGQLENSSQFSPTSERARLPVMQRRDISASFSPVPPPLVWPNADMTHRTSAPP